MTRVTDIWVYLAEQPLLWLTVTLAAYAVADWISARCKRSPLANPVVIAAGLVIVALKLSDTDFGTYFEGAQFVHFMLGPATVALAVPLVENIDRVRKAALPIVLALFAGSTTAIITAVAVGWALGAPRELLMSLAPKSVTTPIAMGLSETLGGIPTLTAVLVIATGVLGAVIITPLMNAIGCKDPAARGFAVGLAAHGIGTARAFQVSEIAGAFAGLAMGLNGLATALLMPLLAQIL